MIEDFSKCVFIPNSSTMPIEEKKILHKENFIDILTSRKNNCNLPPSLANTHEKDK